MSPQDMAKKYHGLLKHNTRDSLVIKVSDGTVINMMAGSGTLTAFKDGLEVVSGDKPRGVGVKTTIIHHFIPASSIVSVAASIVEEKA